MKYSVRYLLPVLTIATLLWFTGCADAPSPVAPATDHPAPATGAQSFFVVSGPDVQPAGKRMPGSIMGEDAATLTRAIGQWGGMLLVSTDGPNDARPPCGIFFRTSARDSRGRPVGRRGGHHHVGLRIQIE